MNDIQVLIIEDNPGDVRLIREMLKEAESVLFYVTSTDTLAEGIRQFSSKDFDVVLLDLGLPDSSGLATFNRLHAFAETKPIIVLTGLSDESLSVDAMHRGAQDYLVKGMINADLLVRAIRYAIERNRVDQNLRKSYATIEKLIDSIIDMIARIVEGRDPYTAGHEKRVARIASAIARKMGLPPEKITGIRIAALLHDVGKMYVPVEILGKPGRLTKLEYDIIKVHAQAGFEILKDIAFPWPVAQIVLEHQERYDGSGYPRGLAGEQILLEARIVSVADVVEAMSNPRPYRMTFSRGKAIDEIVRNRGILYDPAIVDACLKIIEQEDVSLQKEKA